jgi:hypothetical protein
MTVSLRLVTHGCLQEVWKFLTEDPTYFFMLFYPRCPSYAGSLLTSPDLLLAAAKRPKIVYRKHL